MGHPLPALSRHICVVELHERIRTVPVKVVDSQARFLVEEAVDVR
jgi:hypothetical protein